SFADGSVDPRATPDARVSDFYARLSSKHQPVPQKPLADDSKSAAPSAIPVKHDVAPAAEEPKAEPLQQTESQESRAARRLALEPELLTSERGPLTNKFSTDGDVCSTSYKGKATVRKHSIGMRYLQELIRYAGRSIHSDKLVALERPAAFVPYSVDDLESQSEPEQEQFDREAIRSIDDRIRERLPFVLAARRANEAEAIRLEGEIEEFKKERDRLTFRKKVRPNSRNRQSVSQAIDRAIGEIGEKDPELAAHLKEKIRKGMECIYSDKQTPWEF
ncbi:MAG: hypothetical protein DMG72_23990, partial [Acidobacteria bacterium]